MADEAAPRTGAELEADLMVLPTRLVEILNRDMTDLLRRVEQLEAAVAGLIKERRA